MSRNEYARMYYQRMREDPEKYEKRMQSIRRRREAIRNDPLAYQVWKEKQREYARRTYENKKARLQAEAQTPEEERPNQPEDEN